MTSPIDDIACLWRAQAYSPTSTVIPNEGSRSEPLVLGPTLNVDVEDPSFVQDATIGDHLLYTSSSYAVAPVPPVVLNGDITLAIRYRTTALWADRLLLSIVEPDGQLKRFMLHQTSGNKYMARFWEAPPNWSQIGVTSTTVASTSRTDTIVITWDSATKQISLYINGALEAIGGTGNPRADAIDAPLQVPYPGTTLFPAGMLFALGHWTRALSAQEVADLQDDPVWLNETAPPPPLPGVLLVRINGVEQPGATVTIDGVPVEPEGTTDTIVEVTTA